MDISCVSNFKLTNYGNAANHSSDSNGNRGHATDAGTTAATTTAMTTVATTYATNGVAVMMTPEAMAAHNCGFGNHTDLDLTGFSRRPLGAGDTGVRSDGNGNSELDHNDMTWTTMTTVTTIVTKTVTMTVTMTVIKTTTMMTHRRRQLRLQQLEDHIKIYSDDYTVTTTMVAWMNTSRNDSDDKFDNGSGGGGSGSVGSMHHVATFQSLGGCGQLEENRFRLREPVFQKHRNQKQPVVAGSVWFRAKGVKSKTGSGLVCPD
ncbi:hypothetical protein EDB89DRAFT_1901139 [Lactarius sanguifluus]|nr:hypothetical protein EDB89DRAFT_1901139 [Lactarius sanguifluus]